jgi:hypothetical protein
MMMGAKFKCIAGVALLAIAPGTLRAEEAGEFRDIRAVEVLDFIGKVSVKTGGDTVTVRKVEGTDADYPFHMEVEDGRLVLRSDEDPDETRWRKDVDWRGDGEKAFDNFLKRYPALDITVPRGTALSFDSVVTRLDADDTDGVLNVREGHVDGVVGDIAEGDIRIDGAGDLGLGDVAGMLNIEIHGSGDFYAGKMSEFEASIHGSGDIEIGNVAGAATATVHGSGDIEMGDVAGDVSISSHGSGDVSAANIAGGARLSTMGSGDLSLASVSGKTAVKIHGSGDVEIGAGRAEDLHARIYGSGDFAMRGLATNPNVAVNGSGSIVIARHDGPVRAQGRGDIRISGVDYGKDN